MNWISISVADLEDTKVAQLVSALREEALGTGQGDPSVDIITSVVDRIRAEIASHQGNRLDNNTSTIPKSLKRLATRLIIAEMKNRLEQPLTEDETAQMTRDVRQLERISEGKLVVDTPDSPIDAPVESSAGAEIASSSPRKSTRQKLSGL